jgi:hypothetical protein
MLSSGFSSFKLSPMTVATAAKGSTKSLILLVGGPERTRTSDLRFRKPLLYPAELRDHARCGWFRLVSGWNRCSGRRSRRGCILFSRTLVQSPYAAAPHGPPATARTPGTTKLTTATPTASGR